MFQTDDMARTGQNLGQDCGTGACRHHSNNAYRDVVTISASNIRAAKSESGSTIGKMAISAWLRGLEGRRIAQVPLNHLVSSTPSSMSLSRGSRQTLQLRAFYPRSARERAGPRSVAGTVRSFGRRQPEDHNFSSPLVAVLTTGGLI
jgi:hypothetical protein